MYEIKIEGHEGYEQPFKDDNPWNIGELIQTFIKTFDGEVTVTVSNERYKPNEEEKAEEDDTNDQ